MRLYGAKHSSIENGVILLKLIRGNVERIRDLQYQIVPVSVEMSGLSDCLFNRVDSKDMVALARYKRLIMSSPTAGRKNLRSELKIPN
jgi:hypothetical protein